MQRNIGKISEWLDPEAAEVKQKDMEIARLKSSEQQLIQVNQTLTIDVSNLQEQMEKQTVLINSLQKGIDASSMLNVKSESDLAACRIDIETMKLEIADKNAEKERNVQLKRQIQELTENLAEARKKNVDIETTNTTLQDWLNQWRDYSEKQSRELIAANDKLGRNTRLNDELKEMKTYVSNTTTQMKSEIVKLEFDLSEAGKANSQILKQKEKFQKEVDVLKSETDELKKRLTDATKANSQLLKQIEKMREEATVLKEEREEKAGTHDTCKEVCFSVFD